MTDGIRRGAVTNVSAFSAPVRKQKRARAMLGSHKLSPALMVIIAAAGALGALALSGGGQSQSEANVLNRVIRNDAPAVVEANRDAGATAGAGQVTVVEITVKPLVVPVDDGLLLRIDLVDSAQYKALGASAPKVASGTVAFFPPAQAGSDRTFVVPIAAAKAAEANTGPLTAVVTMASGNPQRRLGTASIEVIAARVR
jgi:hypothetical protein